MLDSPGLGFVVTAAEDYDATWKAGLHRLDSTQRSSLHLRFSTSSTTAFFTWLRRPDVQGTQLCAQVM